ncbi:MAG: alpha/beta fold hydrolase [Chloroflexi bacterium]|nr:alpha/beta fold hydrolase [Chloroflexota bacterium]
MKWTRVLGFGIGAAAGSYVGISALMARGLTNTERRPLLDDPSSVDLDFTQINFRSAGDRLSLSGWIIRAQSSNAEPARWVVIVHGHSAHRADPEVGALPLARDLVKAGYSVFMFDLRGCGTSRARPASAGYHEQRDLIGALRYLESMGVSEDRIGVVGFSLGGAVAILACGRYGGAAAVVADSSFADLELRVQQSMSGNLTPLKIFRPGMRVMARVLFGIDMGSVSPMRAISESNVPVLLIHGDKDEIVPMIHYRLLARAVEAGLGETWLVEGAGHAQGYRTAPEQYAERVLSFLDRWMDVPVERDSANSGGS